MARRIPENRFDELVRAATEVFIARGYRMTQMSDVAEAVGVAKGTLYGYVEGKDALLTVCLRFADETGRLPMPEPLPVPSLRAGELAQLVKVAIDRENAQPVLAAALEAEGKAEGEVDPAQELREILSEFYDLMYDHRHAIKLLDRCMDHPELAGLWQSQGRETGRNALARYLTTRAEAGRIAPVSNPRLAARFAIETIATWAVHIHWDRAPERFDLDESREYAIESLVRGFLG